MKNKAGKVMGLNKNKMWIACCGCGNAILLPETTTLILMESDPASLVWKSECPYCGFGHRLTLTKW